MGLLIISDSETRNKMKYWKSKMEISGDKDSARATSGRCQRQISQKCRLIETSDPEDRLLRHWVSPLEDAIRQPSSQERGIRELNLIPKKTVAGERDHGYNGGENY